MAKTHEEGAGAEAEEVNEHPIEEVRNTVPTTDDPSEPCLTFRTWVLGMSSCVLLSFVNEFFNYRSSQLSIGTVLVQIASLPIGRLMASTLPGRPVRVPLIAWSFSLNPGPFSLKEHCLITIFAGAGCSGVYALNIVAIVKVFYRRQINPYAAMLLAQTTQLLGYGWAGLFRKFLVDSAYMWWPINLVQSHARGGEASQGRCDASPVLRHRRHLQLRLLPHPELPVPVAEHRVGAVLAVQGLGDGAADRVGPAGPRHRLLRPGLEHGGRLPRQPAGVAGVHRRQRHGRVRAHHLRRAAAALLDGHLQRQALPAHLAARLRRRRKALRHWPRPQPRHLHAQPRRLRRLQPHQRQRALRCQLRHRLRQPHVHALARRALPRKGGLGRPLPEAAAPEDRCRRRAHEDHEAELQARAAVVVPPHARRRARALALHLRGLRPAAAAPLLGPPPCLRHRLRLHPPRRCHLRHHQHAAGAQHRHRAHHRLPLPGEAAGQRGVQDVRLHQHGPGAGVPGRLEAGPLHEDTPEVHVLRAARRNAHGVHGALRHRVVAAHHGQGHLRRGQAPRRQPLDVPRRRRLLQRLHHLGRRRPAADVRQPR
uniref:Uncharacterized protein n=1 Tax=Zea mays TaxID=4577 RepID=A0A804NW06_MAIZE